MSTFAQEPSRYQDRTGDVQASPGSLLSFTLSSRLSTSCFRSIVTENLSSFLQRPRSRVHSISRSVKSKYQRFYLTFSYADSTLIFVISSSRLSSSNASLETVRCGSGRALTMSFVSSSN